MSSEIKDISLPTLSLKENNNLLIFTKGSYITDEHIEYIKSEGFVLENIPGKNCSHQGVYGKRIETAKCWCTIIIGHAGIAVIYSTPSTPSGNFKLKFVDYSGFGSCYDEMVKTVLEKL